MARMGNARQQILDAAAGIAAERGVLGMTVEQVIERAGVSKGGFFYHFKTKEEMTRAMLESVADAFDAAVEARVAAGGGYARALADETLAHLSGGPAGDLISPLLTAVAVQRDLTSVIAARYDAWEARLLTEGFDRPRAMHLRLVLDGLLLSASLGIVRYEGARLGELRHILDLLTQP